MKEKEREGFSHTSRPQTQLLWYRKDHDLPTFLTSWTSHTYRLWSLYIHVTYNTNHDILQSLYNTQHFHQFLFGQEDYNTHRYFFYHTEYKSTFKIQVINDYLKIITWWYVQLIYHFLISIAVNKKITKQIQNEVNAHPSITCTPILDNISVILN